MNVVLVLLCFALAIGSAVTLLLLRLPQADVKAAVAVSEEILDRPRVRRFLRSRLEPGVATGLALTALLLATVAGGTLIGVLIYMIRMNTGVVGWDRQVAIWAADNASQGSTRVLEIVTDLGTSVTIIALSLATAAFGYKRWRRWAIPLFLFLVVGGELLISNLIKVGVERARPAIRPLASFSGPSFPSGHATAAAATFAAIALVVGRGRSARSRALFGGAAAAIAVAVACSRVFLGVHWLSDVLGGLALGWGWFAVVAVAFGGRILRFGVPVEMGERLDVVPLGKHLGTRMEGVTDGRQDG